MAAGRAVSSIHPAITALKHHDFWFADAALASVTRPTVAVGGAGGATITFADFAAAAIAVLETIALFADATVTDVACPALSVVCTG